MTTERQTQLLAALHNMRNVPGGRTSFQFQDEVIALFDRLENELAACRRDAERLAQEADAVRELACMDAATEMGYQNKIAALQVNMPEGLHPDTQSLVLRFATAMAHKLHAAEIKYGYSDGWGSTDWMDECRKRLREHLNKGDPRDVANYCAFLWHHNESTAIAAEGEK